MAVIVNQKLCKGCNICVAFCPKQVLALDALAKIQVQAADRCIDCGQCALRCPDLAIRVTREKRGGDQ